MSDPGWSDMVCAVCGCDLTNLDPAYHYWTKHQVMPQPLPVRAGSGVEGTKP